MSLILALDSSTDACSVALYRHGELLSQFELAAKSHTQRLLPMVDELLQQGGLKLNELDAIAFGRGPGSFTGLRICAGIVQGLAFGAQLPVIPVSTLEAMALGHIRRHPDLDQPTLLVALDARMNEVYWGLFQPEDDGVKPLGDEHVMPPEILAGEGVIRSLNDLVGIGPGWHYPAMQSLGARTIVSDIHPHAEDIALIAAKLWEQGVKADALDAQPVYLRDSVSWQKRQRIRNPDQI